MRYFYLRDNYRINSLTHNSAVKRFRHYSDASQYSYFLRCANNQIYKQTLFKYCSRVLNFSLFRVVSQNGNDLVEQACTT
jgi:hypothetical protein